MALVPLASRVPSPPFRTRRRPVRPVQALAATLLVAALALTGCSGADDSGSSGSAADKAAPGAAKQQEGGGSSTSSAEGATGSGNSGARTVAPSANQIIRTASLTVRVKDVAQALDETRTAVENAGGFVGDEDTDRADDGRERSRIVLRVPADRYDEVLADLEGTGKLLSRSSKAEDVTDQVVDVDSRIRSQRASVARVRELMDRATKLSDVVSLEGELSSREADLESLLAQQASLKDRVGLATITLVLSEPRVKAAKPAKKKNDAPGFMDALSGGWHVFVTILRWLALAFGALLPFAVVGALLVLLWARLVRPRLPKRPETGLGEPEQD